MRRRGATDGNLTQDADFDYVYDGESRLISVTPRSPGSGDRKVTYTYDYLGRRVEKKVFVHNGSAWPGTPATIRRFMWYNWLMLVEYEDDSGTNRTEGGAPLKRAYTWGLDLSQNSLESAGGIGGLVAFEDRNATSSTSDDVPYFVWFDTHGNVGQIVASEDDYGAASGTGWHTDRLAARYEYDAFGVVVGPDDDNDDNWRDDAGSYASDNPIRFSTKYFDDETAPDQGAGGSAVGLSSPFAATQGLGYWGLRFYGPRWGRWTNHDPIGEAGGENLYAAMGNALILASDALGHLSMDSGGMSNHHAWCRDMLGFCLDERQRRLFCWDFGCWEYSELECDPPPGWSPPPPPPPIVRTPEQLACLEEAKAVYEECKRTGKNIYEVCKRGADRFKAACYAECSGLQEDLAIEICKRGCDVVYAIQYANVGTCRLVGWLAVKQSMRTMRRSAYWAPSRRAGPRVCDE